MIRRWLDVVVERVHEAPAQWLSIPGWARAWAAGRRLLGRDPDRR